jgi:hypothetical protein
MLQALVITDASETRRATLSTTHPEADIHALIGGPVYVVALTHLAEHLDMWTLVHQMVETDRPDRQPLNINAAATGILAASIPADSASEIRGTAVITSRTPSGLVASLSDSDARILDSIAAHVRTRVAPAVRPRPDAIAHHRAS